VIGGLLVSTVITLVFVPTLYSIAETRLKRAHR
jgi:multidrug efflux pump subunit AcrB